MSQTNDIEKTSYKIGQVLYVFDENRVSVKPIRVVEEVQTKTIKGTETSYIVEFIDKNGSKKKIDLSKITQEIYQNPKKLKDFMVKKATESMINIVNAAVDIADKTFNESDPHIVKINVSDRSAVDVLNKPPQLSSFENRVKTASSAISEHIKAAENELVTVTLPDGTKARVQI